jgi:hypothetical protein
VAQVLVVTAAGTIVGPATVAVEKTVAPVTTILDVLVATGVITLVNVCVTVGPKIKVELVTGVKPLMTTVFQMVLVEVVVKVCAINVVEVVVVAVIVFVVMIQLPKSGAHCVPPQYTTPVPQIPD